MTRSNMSHPAVWVCTVKLLLRRGGVVRFPETLEWPLVFILLLHVSCLLRALARWFAMLVCLMKLTFLQGVHAIIDIVLPQVGSFCSFMFDYIWCVFPIFSTQSQYIYISIISPWIILFRARAVSAWSDIIYLSVYLFVQWPIVGCYLKHPCISFLFTTSLLQQIKKCSKMTIQYNNTIQ